MALSTLQQLLKKSPPHSRILASLQNTHLLQSPNANPPVNSHHLETKPNENNSTIDGRPFLCGSSKVENLTHLNPWLFSPISPVQIFSYQNLSSGSAQDGSNDDDSGMWADSVKKKRKKKMNKHKYRKLKKRLRKRTYCLFRHCERLSRSCNKIGNLLAGPCISQTLVWSWNNSKISLYHKWLLLKSCKYIY
ncbi:hypothetical protein NC651_003418 [Populus alba x Populus x berolinensis]|nr:hypothetical protein NC651_003418 [Populus alba x Populus x berolinensis]